MKKFIGISIFVFTVLCIIFIGTGKINGQTVKNDTIVINGNWDWDKEITMGSVVEFFPSFKAYSVSRDYKIGFKLVGQDGSVLLDELVSPYSRTSKWSGTKQWVRSTDGYDYRGQFTFNVPKIASAPFKSKYKVLAGLSDGSNFIPLIPYGTTKASNVYTNMYEIGDITVYNSPVTIKDGWTGPKTAIVGSDLKLSLNFEGGPTDKDYYVGVIFSDSKAPFTNRFYTSILPEIKTSNWSGKISVPITVKVPDNLPFDNQKDYTVKVVLTPTKLTDIPPKSSYALTLTREILSALNVRESRPIGYPSTPIYTVGYIKFQRITPPVPISVVYPNGNERIKIGDKFDIKWTGKDFPSNAYVNMSLVDEYGSNGIERYSFGKVPSRGNGSATVSVKDPYNNPRPGQYKVRLQCLLPSGINCSDFPISEDYSDSYFTLLDANATNTNSTIPVVETPPKVPVINSQQPITINQWYVYSSHSGSVATAKPSTANSFSSINYSVSFKGGPTVDNNNVFVHFVDGNGKIVLTSDLTPSISSSKWDANSINFVSTDVEIPVNMQPGSYKVMAGLYGKNGRVSLNPGPGVLAADAENRYQIGTVNILKASSAGLQSYNRNDAVTAPDSETVNNVSPSISVMKPIKNSVFKIGDVVTTSWSNQNVDADYYYILLENTALKDVGFIVKDNLVGVSATSFNLSSALSKVISLNTTNLTESQINGRYFVRVVAMKKATPYDKVVSGGTSDLFSINSGNNNGTVSTTTNPYLGIVSPVGNRTYQFGSRIYIAWNARNVDADYYYALLENTAIKDYGFVVANNIPLSTTTTSFVFNKNILDTMLSGRVGLTEAQLQNGYYVRIIGVKKDLPGSNTVINATSGTFSISNSSDLMISNTSVKLGSPVIANVMGNNVTVSQPYEMSLTITNNSNDAVYIRNKGDGRDVVFNTTPYTATSTPPFISAIPATVSGDGINYFMIPVGASRTFTYNGSLKNSGSMDTVSHEMVGIVSGKSNVWPEGYIITLPQGSLRLSTVFGTGTDSNPVINSINPSSGSVGTVITLKGKNLAGFEGDLDAWIKNSNGQVAYLPSYGKPQANQITVLIPDKACKANNSYSGLPCKEYLPIVPGNYKIFTSPWGKNSNDVYFTVKGDSVIIPSPTPNTTEVSSSNNSMRVISPNGGEVLKKGSLVNIYYNKKPNDGSYRTDMYLIANDSQNVYTIQGKAGGTGIVDSSLDDSVVMYGWTVGSGSIINGVATSDIPAGYYRLKVCLTGTNICDLSDRAFAISEITKPTPTPYGSTPTPTPVYSSSPSPTPIPVYSSSPSPTPTPVYSSTPTPTPVYSSSPSPTPTPYVSTPTPTATPVYSSSPSPTSTYSSTPTPTPSPTSSSSPRPSSSPVAFMIDQNSLNASIWSIVKNLFSI
jgi:hypothetical protein